MTENFFRRFLKTAFIGMIFDDDSFEISLIGYKGKNKIVSETKKFDIQGGIYPTTLLAYIEQIYTNYPYVYSATMLTSVNQGAIPECTKGSFEKFQVDSRNIKNICINGAWSIYCGNSDIADIEKQYEKLGGIDFVFSPVSVLDRFFAKDIAADGVVMGALKLKSLLCIGVFNEKKMLYSSLMQIKMAKEAKTTSSDTSESTFEDFFDDEEVHDLGGDGMVDLEELSVSLDEEISASPALSANIEDEAFQQKNQQNLMSLESAGSDLRLADFIKESVGDFYKNPAYEAAFVEKVFIADPVTDETDESDDSKMILENELMIGVEVRQIPISMVLCQMAIDEVNS